MHPKRLLAASTTTVVIGRVCIYCLHDKDTSAFNTEHVIPQAFGRFRQNLTLDCVCAECNAEFGKTIDLALGRDSLEAFLRLIHGTKPARDVAELGSQRLSMTLGGDLDWEGCRIELKEENGEVAVDLVPQCAFVRRQGGWSFVTEEQLLNTAAPLPADIETGMGQDIRLICRPGEMEERLVVALGKRGITLEKKGVGGSPPDEGGFAQLEAGVRLDDMLLRGVAKIAFNYMARVVSASFARAESFDTTRRFVRYGVKPPRTTVIPRRRPILADDTLDQRQTNGHLLTLDWADGGGVVAGVSLFNGPTYTVVLTDRYRGLLQYCRSARDTTSMFRHSESALCTPSGDGGSDGALK